MLQKISQFMYGRYGMDKMSLVLLIFGACVSVCGFIFWRPLVYVADVFYIYVLFRALSKNLPARQRELEAFNKLYYPAAAWVKKTKQRLQNSRQYKYFRCPNCHQELRAPRGRGKIMVTCQKCRKEFIKRV